jgi:WD40 repeat protein
MSAAAEIPARSTAAGFCPYVGLAPFEASHAEYYFGRGLDAANLADNVLVAPVTVLYGASGVGKTSLLNVGLRKALKTFGRDATLVLFRRWQGDQFRPSLLREIASAAGIPASDLHAAPRDLADFAAWIGERTGKPLILGLDQFEEYFVYQDRERARTFEEELDALVRPGAADAHVLIAVRDDRYHLLDRLRSTVSGILDNSLELAHLDESAVREAISGPIAVYNQRHPRAEPIVLEPVFVDRLVAQLREVEAGVGKGALDAEDREIELPYLQLALIKIWQATRPSRFRWDPRRRRRLDEAILQQGGVRQIVRNHLDEVLGALEPEDKALCARIFDRVVTPSGAKIAMKAADLAVLAGAGGQTARVQRILDELSRPGSRIFMPVPHPEGAPAYEIFHDVLGRPVLDWKERYEAEIQREKERLEAERRVEEQRRRADEEKRRFRITATLAAAMTLLAVAAVGFGWYALSAKREADAARAEALLRQTRFLTVASREELQKGHPVTSELLALEALPDGPKDTDTPYFIGAEEALWKAWQHNQELKYLAGHQDVVRSAAFSPDGAKVVTASDDRTARLWDAASSKELAALQGHEGEVFSAEFSPDGAKLVTGSADDTARVWDAATGKELAVLQGHEGEVKSAAFSPDGAKVVTGSADDTARVWDAANGKELALLQGHEGEVKSAAFSPDGSKVVTASADRSARVWDAASGEELAVLDGHEGEVFSAAFSPDGAKVVTASDDNTARLWDVPSGHGPNLYADMMLSFVGPRASAPSRTVVHATKVLDGHKAEVRSVVFSPDGAKVVTASADGAARVWGVASGQGLAVLDGHEGEVFSAAFSADGAKVVTSSADDTARVWDAANGKELALLQGHEGEVKSAAFSADGAKVVTASADRSARVWDAASGKELAVLQGHAAEVLSAAFSPDGAKVVTGSADGTARLLDLASGRELAVLQGHQNWVRSAAFSPDGSKVVTASDDHSARLWDALSGKDLAVLDGHQAEVWSAAFSPDGAKVVTASADGTARVWDAASGKGLAVLQGHEGAVYSAAFSPNGAKVATASADRTARLWDAANGKELAVLQGHRTEVRSVSFSPNGAKVVTASSDRTSRVWDAASGKELAVLHGHEAEVWSAAFSPDGAKVVTASADGTARFWDAASGIELAVLQGHEDWVRSAAFSPDGSKVVTASDDRTARIWPGSLWELIKTVRAGLSRQRFTEAEKERFFLTEE